MDGKITVGVVVGTYGNESDWQEYAESALLSVSNQTMQPDAVEWSHGDTLKEARNSGVKKVDTDHVIFLDADDELDPTYVEAMWQSQLHSMTRSDTKHFIHRPATLGVVDGVEDDEPVMIPQRDLRRANYIVIGAMFPSQLFKSLGGFNDYPILEDWDLWQRMVLSGAKVLEVPEAVYRVNVRENSRNSDLILHSQVYRQIVASHAKTWRGL